MEGRKDKMVNNVELNFDTIVSQNKSIDATEIDNEKVMMNISKGQYYALNSVGSKIWDVIEDKRTVREVVSILLSEYEIDQKNCEESVMNFLGSLQNEDLIEVY
jgi:hypothetical protein